MTVKEALDIIKELENLKAQLQVQLPKKYSDSFFLAADKIKKYQDHIDHLKECIGNQEMDDQNAEKFTDTEEYWIKK